jgi:hypothetical protein
MISYIAIVSFHHYFVQGEAQKPPAQELEIPHAEPASADVTSNDAMSSEVSYTDAHEAYSRHTESVDVEDEIVDNKLHQVDLMNVSALRRSWNPCVNTIHRTKNWKKFS